ncbi:hypothetical protein [Virgibacillus salinus]|uniref:Uncharacterized protein n=1 Tax=Virgibacillus salinus TaxID=553311 RepID=A0A1H0XV31_9BACI|nr:hypothetical protein [Virgibacillus salinus]SDQ06743.1 hypothetical protein SAMN05216231_0229 [Virgibacillus salinus]
MNQEKNTVSFSRLEIRKQQRMLSYKEFEDWGIIDKKRDVKDIKENEYLRFVSQYKFRNPSNLYSFWIEGQPLGVTPIISEEKFHIIGWSLMNNDYLEHPFALANEMDGNYQKFLTAINVSPLGDMVPADIIMARCGLLVTVLPELVEGYELPEEEEEEQPSYFLHDVCSIMELADHRLNRVSDTVSTNGRWNLYESNYKRVT